MAVPKDMSFVLLMVPAPLLRSAENFGVFPRFFLIAVFNASLLLLKLLSQPKGKEAWIFLFFIPLFATFYNFQPLFYILNQKNEFVKSFFEKNNKISKKFFERFLFYSPPTEVPPFFVFFHKKTFRKADRISYGSNTPEGVFLSILYFACTSTMISVFTLVCSFTFT